MESVIEAIYRLKKERNAILLAHHYQREEIQSVADIVGDSLALSRAAAEVQEEVIVFCGVHFMAETAKILSPDKTVLLPVREAGCPMADMVTAEALRKKKRLYPEAVVVCYVNSSAEVKAESDVCCTSSNAVDVVRNLEANQILFVPDQNLGQYVAKQVPEKEIILWEGYCITHHRIEPDVMTQVRKTHPQIKVLLHPECQPNLVAQADYVGSTAQIINYVNQSTDSAFIIGTEMGILTSLENSNPDKKFYMLSPKLICANMKKNRLEDVKRALEENTYEVQVETSIGERAIKALNRMLIC